MKLILAAALIALLASSPVTAEGFFYGENLLVEVPDSPSDWDVMAKDGANIHSRIWIRKGDDYPETFMINTLNGMKENLESFRRIQDDAGRKKCDKLESSVIDSSPRNGFLCLMWTTKCVRGGEHTWTAATIQLAIQGNDSLYHIQKGWRSKFSNQEWALWKNRLSSASVCDTRKPDLQCPEGFHRVK